MVASPDVRSGSSAPDVTVGPEPNGRKSLDFTQENALAAGAHWVEFIEEVEAHMIGRTDAIAQMELAILSRKHALELGHGGTAKSTLMRLLLKRIVDEAGRTSLFDHQLHVESRRGDVVGPKLPVTDPLTGEMSLRLRIEQGLSPYIFAFLDEIFDAPPAVLRGALLTAMVDHVIAEGGETYLLNLQTAGAASNKTLEELKAKFKDELDALLDRFAFLFWTVKRPIALDEAVHIARADGQRKLAGRRGKPMGMTVPPMTFAELDVLHKTVDYVQERMIKDDWAVQLIAEFYRTYHEEMDHAEEELGRKEQGGGRSKMESMRTQNLILDILPAIAVRRWCRDPNTPLAVIPEDFNDLRLFLMMRGPDVRTIPPDIDVIGDKQDKKILERLRVEDRIFNEVYRRVVVPRAAGLSATRAGNVAVHQRTIEAAGRDEERVGGFRGDDLKTFILQNIRDLLAALRELSTQAAHVGRVESSYAQGVGILITFLIHAIENGQIRMAVKVFREHVKTHTEALRHSFYRTGVGESEEAFRNAVRREYEEMVRRSRITLGDVTAFLDEVTKLEDILGADVIPLLADMVKRSALSRALAQPFKGARPEEVSEACKEYMQWDALRTLLEEGGSEEGVPLGELAVMHTKTLNQLLVIVEQTVDGLEGNLWTVDQVNAVLTEVDNVLGKHEAIKGGLLQNCDARQLPGEAIRLYLSDRAEEKKAGQKDTDVRGECDSTTSATSIHVVWKTASKASKRVIPESTREEYRLYCLEQLWTSEDGLLDDPELKNQWGRALLMAQVVFGKDWTPIFEGVFRESYIQAIRLAHTTGDNAEFLFPIEPSHVTVRAKFPIAATAAAAAVERALERAKDTPIRWEGFLVSRGYEPTADNVTELQRHLASTSTKQEKFTLESIATKEEDVSVGDIVAHATSDRQNEWARLHYAISEAVQRLGAKVGDTLAQEALQGMRASSGPLGPREFIEKYDALLTRAASAHTGQAFSNIKVDLSVSPQLAQGMERDLESVLEGIVPDPRNDLSMGLDALNEIRTFLVQAPAIDSARFIALVDGEAKKKVTGWLQGKKEAYQALGNVTAGMSEGDDKVRIDIIHGTLCSINIGENVQEVERQLTGINADFLPEKTAVADQIKRLKDEANGMVGALASQAVDVLARFKSSVEVEGVSQTFRLDDLDTIVPENVETVDRYMRDVRVISKAEEIVRVAQGMMIKGEGADGTEGIDFEALMRQIAEIGQNFRNRISDMRNEAANY